MYNSYLFCANYALFVLSSFVDRASHSDVSWLFQCDCICRFQTLLSIVDLPEANHNVENLENALL